MSSCGFIVVLVTVALVLLIWCQVQQLIVCVWCIYTAWLICFELLVCNILHFQFCVLLVYFGILISAITKSIYLATIKDCLWKVMKKNPVNAVVCISNTWVSSTWGQLDTCGPGKDYWLVAFFSSEAHRSNSLRPMLITYIHYFTDKWLAVICRYFCSVLLW